MEHDVLIDYNLETTQLKIKTDTRDNEIDTINLKLYGSESHLGTIVLSHFIDPLDDELPFYQIRPCMSGTSTFPSFPREVDKIWVISKLPGPRITVQCNEETLVDFHITEETCNSGAKANWLRTRKVEKIMFPETDKASDFYAPGQYTLHAILLNSLFLYSHERYHLEQPTVNSASQYFKCSHDMLSSISWTEKFEFKSDHNTLRLHVQYSIICSTGQLHD